jgi:SAM-dependent methyltransferase
MSVPTESGKHGYDDSYREFDSPLMQQIRREAYGADIGQHSWVTAEDLEQDIVRLQLSRISRFLDLGCGPGGPLTFVVGRVGCRGTGVDLSSQAITAGRARAASLGIANLITLQEADLNAPLPFATGSFDAVMSLDVLLHLRDREAALREVARILAPGGRLLFTDAGIATGEISEEEMRARSVQGAAQFVTPGHNERILELAGFRLLEIQDRTASLLKNAAGRLTARLAHRAELEPIEGSAYFASQNRYLETVIALSQRGAASRMMYLAERQVEIRFSRNS